MKLFIDSILFSYAQILFSNRRWFGATVLLSTFIIPDLGLIALLGVVLSNLAAYVLKFDETKIKNGFYGFNGILFGAATSFYFHLTPFLLAIVAVFIIITFFVSAVLEHHLASVFNLPGLSLPFVVTLYVFVIFLTNYDFIDAKEFRFVDYEFLSFLPLFARTYFKSLALIVFQSSILSGIIFAGAILAFSRVMFMLSIIGFAASELFVRLVLLDQSDTMLILSGFNSILTAFALGGNLIIPSRKSFVLTIIASLMVVIVTGFFLRILTPLQLPVLVLPFNFIALSVIYSLKFRRDQSELVLLYFQPGSPEENYYYHHNRASRFDRFKTTVPELPFFGEWSVSQGHSGEITHKDKWKHAWDFVVTDAKGDEATGNKTALKDYLCYKLPVVAPLDGTVARVVDGVPNNDIGDVNLEANWGNTVVIEHSDGLFSAVSHLDPFSTKLEVGQKVKKGDAIGACGNSGRSPTPHLHFQFQSTDRLGDRTIRFPIGHYLERDGQQYRLHSFDVPEKDALVQNLETHKLIKRAFDFKYGDKLAFVSQYNGRTIRENWEVKVDMQSIMYIESSAGAIAYVYVVGKVFYLTNFIGNRKCALYFFYLMSLQVPLCFRPNLSWEDELPVSRVMNNLIRFLSEFFLVFKPQIRARGSFSFEERPSEGKEYVLKNTITVRGAGLFAWYAKELTGRLTVDQEGTIQTFEMHDNGRINFSATATSTEEETS